LEPEELGYNGLVTRQKMATRSIRTPLRRARHDIQESPSNEDITVF
jgi:hypothetical protein